MERQAGLSFCSKASVPVRLQAGFLKWRALNGKRASNSNASLSPGSLSGQDKATKAKLERGARLVELLKQPQYQPMPAHEQVASIYAATRGHMDDVPVERIREFESKMLAFMRDSKKDALEAIKEKKVIDEAVEKSLTEAIAAFKKTWQA